MKLSSLALGAVLSSPSWTSAFAPVSFGNPLALRAPSTPSYDNAFILDRSCTDPNTVLSMIGGGMIERPPSESEDDDDDDDDEESSRLPTYRETEERLSALYASNVLDPFDPDPPIKPRPGKYGWKSVERELKTVPDESIVQTMSQSEREENLNIMRRLRNNEIPILLRARDDAGYLDANNDLTSRERSDPWYALNERLTEAVKLDKTEEIAKLRKLIDKVGGPPPQLVKYANHPRGYVLHSEVYAKPLSASRLQRIIERNEQIDARERSRLVAIEREKNSKKKKSGMSVEEIAALRAQRQEELMKGMEAKIANVAEKIKEDAKKEDEERKELLAKLGGDEPDNVYSTSDNFLEEVSKEFVSDLKRIFSEFEDEDDEDSLGPGGGSLATTDGDSDKYADRPLSKAAKARAEAMKNDGSGRPRLPGDADVTRGELEPNLVVNESSSATTGPLTVEVSSAYNTENSDPPMRKHCFQYTVRITNNSSTDTVQLLSRRFEIQTVGSSMKDVVQGEGVTGRQPILQPGEVFEYTSTAPLSVRPIGTTEIAARMSGEYRYCVLKPGQDKATEEQINKGQGEAGAELATFHFVFPEEQRVKPVRPANDDDDDDEDAGVKTTTVASSKSTASTASPASEAAKAATSPPASSLPGEPDMTSGNISITPNDSSDTVTSDVRVVVTSTYRPERSDAKLDKHCFAYNVRITNESKENKSIQLVSRRFEIQTVGSANKDVVQGPGVTGRQPVLKPGESFEYTSTAPLSVRPMLDKTKVVARMSGEYNFVQLAADGVTPLTSTPLKAELGAFHFILPE